MIAPNLFSPPSRLRVAGAIFFAAAFLGPAPRLNASSDDAFEPPAPAALEAEAYGVIEWLNDKRLPRLLSTDDIDVASVRPEALLPVLGDFDGRDGRDIAFSGVYTLPAGNKRYFVLAASLSPLKILWREDRSEPVFVHRPGTTGPGDPGVQAFSVTSCVDCGKGADATWMPREGTFRLAPWKGDRITETRRLPVAPAPEVPEADAEAALQAAGKLKDVLAYVNELKAGGGTLGTRVEPVTGSEGTLRVLIFEKKPDGDKLYDAIEVRLSDGAVVKRRRG